MYTITHDAYHPIDEPLLNLRTSTEALVIAREWSLQRPGIEFRVHQMPNFRLVGAGLNGNLSAPPIEVHEAAEWLRRPVRR